MIAVFKRELRAYFLTPLGYVFAGVFLTACCFVYYVNNILTRSGDLNGFFSMMGYLWMLLCPLLVMRLIAGERRYGTEALLLTAPVTLTSLIVGKYLAACAVLLITAVLSLIFPLVTHMLGALHLPEVLTGYLGFMLMGCAFIAFDLMISALFSNPNSAMMFSVGANLLLWLVSLLAVGSSSLVRGAIGLVNLYDRATPFLYGQLSPANIVYFVAFTACCLGGCLFLMQARRLGKLS